MTLLAPPVLDDVLEQLPSDFLADHPPTDRLMQAVLSWQAAKSFALSLQQRDEELTAHSAVIESDFVKTLTFLQYAIQFAPEDSKKEIITSWLKNFEQQS